MYPPADLDIPLQQLAIPAILIPNICPASLAVFHSLINSPVYAEYWKTFLSGLSFTPFKPVFQGI